MSIERASVERFLENGGPKNYAGCVHGQQVCGIGLKVRARKKSNQPDEEPREDPDRDLTPDAATTPKAPFGEWNAKRVNAGEGVDSCDKVRETGCP